MIPTGFHRPRKGESCFACGKSDWCLLGDDGKRCICKRIVTPIEWGDAGYLHDLTEPTNTIQAIDRKHYASKQAKPRFVDCDAVLQRYLADTTSERINRLATMLGVTPDSLRAIRARWSVRYEAWAFPLTNAERKTVGIRYRKDNGEKFSMKGGSEGVFLPTLELSSTIYMPEGPTDTAALLSVGLSAIGRPNNSNAARIAKTILMALKPAELIIVADRDIAGRDGAMKFAADLRWTCRIISPPKHKDVRQWIQAGATRGAIECVTRAASYRRFAQAG